MTNVENESKSDSNHEFNVYADKQFQGQLLQVDEDSDIESYEIKLAKQGANLKSSAKQSRLDNHADDIIGWFPGAKFSSRKQDSGNTKAETSKSTPFIHPWKDYRSPKKEDTFVFKHYADYRKYMEQYRNEHGCYNNRFSSGNPYGDSRRIAFQTTTPQLPSYNPQYQPNPTPVASNPAGVIFANRREQLGTLVTPTNNGQTCTCGVKQNNSDSSSQYTQKFKLAPGSFQRNNTSSDLRAQLDSDNSSESGDVKLRPISRRSNSATSTRCRSMSKTTTKITVPANPNQRPYPMQALTIQQNIKSEVCPSPKPLDNLNCVAPDKQRHMHTDPSLEGLTWSEKLTILRSVNKPPERPKTKQTKLKFIRDVGHHELFVWSSEKEELFEKRRIRHLVEQSRVKGGKQLDWVGEAKVRAHGVDWIGRKMKSGGVIRERPTYNGKRKSEKSESGKTDPYPVCIRD